ncbi:hypothetical protein R3W88_025742 [Solanum pinnatisectum]|uniref:Uncharacterized protein n=1 Tax=Solanum pinnatisectum TaxID=50273 RepID=A0AAV9M7A5_9SOLN|nr:hypothetical protein R3W88_025742 [Solanum pinnatisectum]
MLEFAERVGWKLQKRDKVLISEFCRAIGVEKRVFKAWLHNNNNNKRKKFAKSDILPECLIQKVLCLFSVKEAAKMSILSKTWLHAWSTLSTLKFTFDYHKGNMRMVDDIMERYKDGKIPIEKFELSNSFFNSEVRHLIDKCLDIALQNGVKDLVFGAYRFPLYHMPVFKILAAKSLRELVLNECDLMHHVSLSSGVMKCKSLRNLSLNEVNLDENMLQPLLNSCPLIVTFNFKYCSGLEKIELLNLRKIKSVSIRTHRQ